MRPVLQTSSAFSAAVMAVLLALPGCAAHRVVSVEERTTIVPDEEIYKVELNDGRTQVVDDGPLHRAMLQADGLEVVGNDGTIRMIRYEDVRRIYTRRMTTASALGGGILIGLAVGLTVLWVWGSGMAGAGW